MAKQTDDSLLIDSQLADNQVANNESSITTDSAVEHKEITNSDLSAFNRYDLLSRRIEVLLHASESPLTGSQLRRYLSLSKQELETALVILQQRLTTGVLSLSESASGYRLQIRSEYSSLHQEVFPQRLENLSQALLETLSVIAYKQPVTRSDIEHVRGVTLSSNILRQLFDKGWILEKRLPGRLWVALHFYTHARIFRCFWA